MQITSEHSKIKWNSADTRQGSTDELDQKAYAESDIEFAKKVERARAVLFKKLILNWFLLLRQTRFQVTFWVRKH